MLVRVVETEDRKPPIDPRNPLGSSPLLDTYTTNNPCNDFHEALGWGFNVAWDVINMGGNYEHVRHLRHLIFSGIRKRNQSVQQIRLDKVGYDVEIGTSNTKEIGKITGVMVDRVAADLGGKDHTFFLPMYESCIDESLLYEAMLLNRDLQYDKGDLPYSRRVNDIVRPGNFDPTRFNPFGIVQVEEPEYRTVSLKECREARKPLTNQLPIVSGCADRERNTRTLSQVCDRVLDNVKNISDIKKIMRQLPLMELDDDQFRIFIHGCSMKCYKFAVENSELGS